MESDRRWRWYALLAALRAAVALGFQGMIHPDEFFQNQEVMAQHVLQDQPLSKHLFIPWEYQLPTPNRSVLFPALVAGLPYKIAQWLGWPINGHLLLVLPRLLLCCLSFSIDALLYAVARKLKTKDPLAVLLTFASSWTTLVFLSRPFSNTGETLVLMLCVAVLFLVNPHQRMVGGLLHTQTLLLGSLLALGFFTRFTFLFFFFPLGIELVRRQDELLQQHAHKKDRLPCPITRRIRTALSIALQGLLSFALCSAGIIWLDTQYFRPEASVSAFEDLVIAPLNNLRYNLQYENLQLHGVHPRITHLVVFMPMLFGPLFLQFLRDLISPNNNQRHQLFGKLSVLFPIACLSMAPHQEARFLLPVLVPLHLFTFGQCVSSRLRIVVWLLFNFALTIFFALLHQGGIVPLMLSLSTGSSSSSVLSSCQFNPIYSADLIGQVPLVFYKTYMPPRFLLAGLQITPTFRVIDLAGDATAFDDLPTQIQLLDPSSFAPEQQAHLIIPASIDISRIGASASIASATKIASCFPHISTEDLALDRPLTLDLYLLALQKKAET